MPHRSSRALRVRPRRRSAGQARLVGGAVSVLAVCILAACSSTHGGRSAHRGGGPGRYYPPPGTPDDPWGPYVREASARFSVPDRWIREVMRQESGGLEVAVSSAGAIGLMQVMPDTYDGLRARYGLGDDPYNPHDNVLAGTAYIKEMYDIYGAPGFLAAYNAGPNRLDQYLSGGVSLPDETVNYVASIAPRLAGTAQMTGPLAVYVPGGGATYAQVSAPAAPMPTQAAAAVACDPDAAYDPDRPCTPMPAATEVPQPVSVAASAIYLPPPRAPVASQQLSQPAYSPRLQTVSVTGPGPAGAAAVTTATGGGWAIQVGAFADPVLAHTVATQARGDAPALLGGAQIALPTTAPFGGTVLYRARLTGLSASQASDACATLAPRQIACMVVPPGRGS